VTKNVLYDEETL